MKTYPMPKSGCLFRIPPAGATIVNSIHGKWRDWYWLRDGVKVYISTEPAC